MEIQQTQQIITIKHFKCPNGNNSSFLCTYHGCENSAFICRNPQCQCSSNHKKCIFKITSQFIQSIQSQRQAITQENKDAFISILKNYDEMVASILEEKKNFESCLELFGLRKNTRCFVQMINEGKSKQIKGTFVYKVKRQLLQAQRKKQNSKNSLPNVNQEDYNFQAIQDKIDLYFQRAKHAFIERKVPQGTKCSQCNEDLDHFYYWCYWSKKPNDLKCRRCVEYRNDDGTFKLFENSILVSKSTDRILTSRLGNNLQPAAQQSAQNPKFKCSACQKSNTQWTRYLSLGSKSEPVSDKDYDDLCESCMIKYIQGDEKVRKSIKSWNNAFLRILYEVNGYRDY